VSANEKTKFLPEYVIEQGQTFTAKTTSVLVPESQYRSYLVCEKTLEYLKNTDCECEMPMFDWMSFATGVILSGIATTLIISNSR